MKLLAKMNLLAPPNKNLKYAVIPSGCACALAIYQILVHV